MDPVTIAELQEQSTVTSFAQLIDKQVRRKKDGGSYLKIVLGDRTGRIEGRMWDRIETCRDQIPVGAFVKYRGRTEVYNGVRQLIVQQIREVLPEDRDQGFSEADLIQSAPRDAGEMFQELRSLVEQHTRRDVMRRLLISILEERTDAICTFPAAVEVHHNYRGGFLEHILSVLHSALFFAQKYPFLDSDLLIAGAVLHDIGKLEELSGPSAPVYTSSGQLIGHVVLGRDILREAASRIPGFPPQLRLLLEHIILSHQGQLEWGSPQVPKIPEAMLLHYIDDLDAKMNRFFRLQKEDPDVSDFTRFDRYLERSVFKGDYDSDASESPESS